MSWFVYRLLPPRPSFAFDQNEAEQATMAEHADYWRRYAAEGTALVFGPVDDPSGSWGVGIFECADAEQARRLADADPAITSGMCTYEVLPMLGAILRADIAS